MPDKAVTQKNIHWINYIKAFCMIAIFFIHAEEYFEYSISGLAKYILPFYVNSYFFISGYLFFRKHITLINEADKETIKAERKRFIQNILFRLIIPSALFSAIEFFPSAILQHYEISFVSFVEKVLLGGTFWFISALIVCELILFLLTLTGIKNIFIYFFISLAICFAGISISKSHLTLIPILTINPYYFEIGLASTLFFTAGGVFWKYEKRIDSFLKNYMAILLFVAYFIIVYFFHSHIKTLIVYCNINALGVCVSLLSIILLIFISKKIKWDNKLTQVLEFIGLNSIGFCLLCGAIPKTMSKVMPKGTLLYLLIGFLIPLIVVYIAVLIMNRYFPFCFDLRKGIYKKKG